MERVFKKVGFAWLCFLVFYCIFFLSVIIFICQLGVSAAFYLVDGDFSFLWSDALQTALEKGYVAGLILGVGLWVKAKIQERKDNKC